METIPEHFSDLEVGILLHDTETGEILYANDFAEDIYGYSSKELQSMEINDFSSGEFSKSEAIQRIQAAANGKSQQFHWRNKRSTGELYWVEVRLSDIVISDKQYVVALVQEITEYKMNLRHLRVLTRITRHNLRNQLNVIEGYFDYIDTSSRNDRIGSRIQQSISKLLSLTEWIDTVKSVNKTESSGETCNIGQLVEDIVETYRNEHPEITWQFECEQVQAVADSTLETAIDELINNAVRHNPNQGLKITVTVEKKPKHKQASICVIDTGIPIPEMEIEPLVSGYDPNPLEHGEGIGLWEVQTIVNAHQGRLSIEKNSSKQKIIDIRLPMVNS